MGDFLDLSQIARRTVALGSGSRKFETMLKRGDRSEKRGGVCLADEERKRTEKKDYPMWIFGAIGERNPLAGRILGG